jgi:hypothetical protein
MAAARERDGSNGYGKYLREIDKADDDLLKLKMEHMTNCKPAHARIRAVMKELREAEGADKGEAFRALLAAHRAERKIAHRLADLEADDRAIYDEMVASLGEFGETALGAAALSRAKPKDGSGKLDTLHS